MESLTSPDGASWKLDQFLDIKFREGLSRFGAYTNNILEFDRLERPRKAVFYFEDFANNEESTFAFLRFFDVEPEARPYNFADMIETSRAWYRSQHGLLDARERPLLKPCQRAAISRELRQQLGEKVQRYLGRYSLDG